MAEAPPAKKAKTEEQAKTAEAETPKELETDAPVDQAPKVKDHVGFHTSDTTLNVVDSMFGNMLSCFTEGGAQHLLAGARASVGLKAGRYMFEINVVELMSQKAEAGRAPQPRNFFRVGLSTAGSSLFIGEDAESICFDAEGFFIHNSKKTQVGSKFERSQNVAMVVNLDPKSPNASTVSLFRGGERICQPQALPEGLQGKALFPTITYRNVTVHYNFGPTAHASLPFKCRTLQDAAAKDVVVSQNDVPKDGKCTAVFPSCLPDEGGFQWLDAWLKENPSYTELSDRAILDWAQKSGITRLKPYSSMICRDKPEMGFGLPSLDDKSVQKMIASTCALQRRNFVVMEVAANLVKDERAKLLACFGDFKKVALVVCGEPTAAFKKMTHKAILEEKQVASDAIHKKKMEEEKKKKVLEKAKKEQEKKKKKDDKAAKKVVEERKKKLQETMKKKEEDKKKAEEAKKAAAGGAEDTKEEDETKKEEEVKEEDAKEESEASEEEPMEVEEAEEAPPIAELTDEEKQKWFKPSTIPDVTASTLATSFTDFELPDKTEGFDEIRYEWANATKSAEHVSGWRQTKKVTARIEDLVVGDWFDARQKLWTKFLQKCKQSQNDYKAALSKRAAAKATKEKLKEAKAIQAKAKQVKEAKIKELKAAQAAAKAEAKAKARAELVAKAEAAGEEVPPEEEEEKEAEPMEVEEAKVEEVEEEEEEEEVVDLKSLEVFGIEDIFEVGGKPIQMPLFSEFAFEDWALMSMRFELNLLVHAFKKDVKDPERAEIHEDNIGFYYQKYFKKGLNPAFFGVKTLRDVLCHLGDTLVINNKKILETFLPGEFETHNMFVLLAEESRRERQRRIDLGEADAKLNMQGAPALMGVTPQGTSPAQMQALYAYKAQQAAAMGRLPGQMPVRVGAPGVAQQAAGTPGAYGQVGSNYNAAYGQAQGAWGAPQQWGAPQMQPWAAPRPVSPWGAQQGMW